MNFSSWLRIDELAEIDTADVSHVVLEPERYGAFSRTFKVDGREYTVDLRPREKQVLDFNLEHIWSVDFSERHFGYVLSHDTKNPFKVYFEVLLTVKTLMQQLPVNGLMWTPHDPKMGLIYERFMNRFFPDFVRVGPNLVLTQQYLDEIMQRLPPRERWAAMQQFERERDSHRKFRSDVAAREAEIKKHPAGRWMRRYVLWQGKNPGLVTKLNPDGTVGGIVFVGGMSMQFTARPEDLREDPSMDPATKADLADIAGNH